MKHYTIEQIRKYLIKQDSMGDILYNLTEENLDKAQEPTIYYCLDCEHEQTDQNEECLKCGSTNMDELN